MRLHLNPTQSCYVWYILQHTPLRAAIVTRTHGTDKNVYIQVYLLTIFSPTYYGPRHKLREHRRLSTVNVDLRNTAAYAKLAKRPSASGFKHPRVSRTGAARTYPFDVEPYVTVGLLVARDKPDLGDSIRVGAEYVIYQLRADCCRDHALVPTVHVKKEGPGIFRGLVEFE